MPPRVVPAPWAPTVTLRASVTPLVPMSRLVVIAPEVEASLTTMALEALPRVPAAPEGALASMTRVPLRRVVVPV